MQRQGRHHTDIGCLAACDDAVRPLDIKGDSMLWKAGVMWRKCPHWHLLHSPASAQAGRIVARLARIRDGVDVPPKWTRAGALIADVDVSLRSWFTSDRMERARPKPAK